MAASPRVCAWVTAWRVICVTSSALSAWLLQLPSQPKSALFDPPLVLEEPEEQAVSRRAAPATAERAELERLKARVELDTTVRSFR